MKLLSGKSSPLFVYHTRKGSVYNLTADHLENSTANFFDITFGHFNEEATKFSNAKIPMSFKSFLGFEEKAKFLLMPNDITEGKSVKGCSQKEGISIKGEGGYVFKKIEHYLEFAKIVKPDVIIPLFEPITKDSGKKGIQRAISKNENFIQKTLSEKLGSEILYPIVISPLLYAIKEQAKKASNLSGIQGLALFGLETLDSPRQREIAISLIKEGCGDSFEELTILANCENSISEIISGISFGIDAFLVNSPFSEASQGKAIKLEISQEGKKTEFSQLDLNNEQFKESPDKIMESCSCYTCQNHTRAYIHHLLSCTEMTANVLLAIHNLRCFEEISKILRNIENPEINSKIND